MKGDFELKVIKKSLMKKYPWIKRMEPRHAVHLQYTTGYHLLCDIDEFEEKEGIDIRGTLSPEVMKQYMDIGEIGAMFLTSIVSSQQDRNKASFIREDIENMIKKIHTSPAIPNELKLNKTPHITSFIFPLTSIYI